jgi:penicillin-binding protein 2
MYNLLTPESHQTLNLERFQDLYNRPITEATVTQINTQLQSLLHNNDQAAATFFAGWQTRLFGPINANNQMNLQFSQGRWGVVWQPTLILPQLGHGVRLAFLSEQPVRGNIYDVEAHALASLGHMVTVGVVPAYLENETEVVEQLAQITRVSPDKIQASIAAARPDWFVPVGQITFETSLELDNLLNNLPGVDRRSQEIRTYTNSDTLSHIIGYMGSIPAEQKQRYLEQGYHGDELVGLSGVEQWAETDLAGLRGGRLVTLSSSHQVLSEISSIEAQAGDSVYLTLDTAFQATVERLLGERLGAIVVLNPHTGEIYATASYPRFKPAVFTTGFDAQAWIDLYTDDNRPLVNRPTQGLYPPGSIFKIITMSAGMNALELKPEDTYTCTGQWNGLGNEFTKKCWLESGHGQISLADGLTQSCDVVFYEVGLALHKKDPQLLPDWAKLFGMGTETGLVGVAENWGVVPDNDWKQTNLNQPLFDGDAVNSAIGQGYMLATPLQVARLVAAIGNGGKLMRPYLIDRVVDIHGAEKTIEPEETGQLPLSPEHLAIIRKSMEAVVSGARGTARSAFEGFPYTVAGKTGTSESGQEEPHAWFAGYTPAEEPQVAIAVILEHAGEGSKEAAPLFRQVAEAFFTWQQA